MAPLQELGVLREAIKAVPAVRYALAVAGLGAVVALVGTFVRDLRVAFFGVIAILILSVGVILFARLSSLSSLVFFRYPLIAVTWLCIVLIFGNAILLTTSVFFGQPQDLTGWITGSAQAAAADDSLVQQDSAARPASAERSGRHTQTGVIASAQVIARAYGSSTISVVDLRLRTTDGRARLVEKLRFDLEDVFPYAFDPCPCCLRDYATGVYSIPFGQVLKGKTEYVVPHSLVPDRTERILLALGGTFAGHNSCVAKLHLDVTFESGEVVRTKSFLVLIESFDESHKIGLDKLGEAELERFIDSSPVASPALTADFIREHFRTRSIGPCAGDAGDIPPEIRAGFPQVPSWL